MKLRVKLDYRKSISRTVCGFTLTELMVVVGIMAIIIAITLPAFRGIGRGAGMRSAIVELKTTLSLARQWGITHRKKTCVVFVPLYTTPNNISTNLYKVYKAYNVFCVTGETNGNFYGYYVKDWTYMPPGVVFDAVATPNQNVFANSCAVNVPFPNSDSGRQSLRAVVFKTDGTTSRGATPYEVYLCDGWANISTNPWSLDYGLQPGSTNRGVEVNGVTGGMRVRDYSMQ